MSIPIIPVNPYAVLEFNNQVHAVLLLKDSGEAGDLVEQVNDQLEGHQRVQGYSVWPEEDFPRTTTRKAKKHEIKAALDQMAKGEAPAQPSVEERPQGEVERLLVRVSGKSPSAVTPNANLGSDLGLDSLARIELVGLLEEQLNSEVAEEQLTEETTVQDLKQMVGQSSAEPIHFTRWSLSRPISVARSAFQRGLILPLYSLFARQSVEGLEHLADLEGSVIFAPNHTSHLDAVAILRALPRRFRGRLTPGQYAEFFQAQPGRIDIWLAKKVLFYFLTFGFNIYPLAQTRGVRQSFRYSGELIDKGWNILVFPEGRRSQNGELQPFQEGIGVLAGEMRIPVVPAHIQGLYEVLPPGRSVPRRGNIVVRFGKPLVFHKESYGEFTQRLEDAVHRLGASEKTPR